MIIRQSTVKRLMEDQHHLNSKFNVARWDESLVSIALHVEFAEMMNEIQTTWKNWKKVEDNKDAAKIEFIDCVHFMLSLLLIRYQNDPDGQVVKLPRLFSRSGDFLTDLGGTFKSFLMAESSFPLSSNKFIEFVDIMTEYLDMDEQEFIRFFETKAQINAERASGGYAVGTYEGKSTEHLRFA